MQGDYRRHLEETLKRYNLRRRENMKNPTHIYKIQNLNF